MAKLTRTAVRTNDTPHRAVIMAHYVDERTMPIHKFLTAVAVTIALAGCSDAGVLPSTAAHPLLLAGMDASQGRADEVARALAMAMQRQDVRVQVRNAMRHSRVTEHKLVLQEFVATPAGAHVLRIAAQQSGMSIDALSARIESLPVMDFYLPVRDHRASWRGGAEVLVGATLSPKQPVLTAYTPAGATVSLDARDGVPAQPVFVLHPAQRKSLRFDPQPDGPGDVIQDFGDGELSGTVQPAVGDGDMQIAGCSIYARECLPDFGIGGGGTGAPVDTTFVRELWINYTDAFGWAGSSEVELRTKYYSGGVVVESVTARFEGVLNNKWYEPNKILMHRRPREGGTDYFRIRIVETDVLDSDDKGTRNFYYTDNEERRSIVDDGAYLETQSVTTIKLGWQPKY